MPIRNKVIIVVIIATVFGLLSGAVGSIVARVYFLEDVFNVPLVGEINLSDGSARSNIIIRDAKKVVIEQNQKILEAVNSAKGNIMTIHTRIQTASSSPSAGPLDVSDFYVRNVFLGSGFIITSDGWLISTYVPEKVTQAAKDKASSATSTEMRKEYERYAAINSEGKIFKVENIIFDETTGLAYWKLEARDLPVRRFVPARDIVNGQAIILTDAKNQVILSNVSAISRDNGSLVRSSDRMNEEIVLGDLKLPEDFSSAYALDLSGDLAGIVDTSGRLRSIDNYLFSINNLLEKGTIASPWLGFYYINLSDLISADPEEKRTGALIAKNDKNIAIEKSSPASRAGLKEGDLIVSVNGTPIDGKNDLNALINASRVGAELELGYLRDGASLKALIKLGELKK